MHFSNQCYRHFATGQFAPFSSLQSSEVLFKTNKISVSYCTRLLALVLFLNAEHFYNRHLPLLLLWEILPIILSFTLKTTSCSMVRRPLVVVLPMSIGLLDLFLSFEQFVSLYHQPEPSQPASGTDIYVGSIWIIEYYFVWL